MQASHRSLRSLERARPPSSAVFALGANLFALSLLSLLLGRHPLTTLHRHALRLSTAFGGLTRAHLGRRDTDGGEQTCETSASAALAFKSSQQRQHQQQEQHQQQQVNKQTNNQATITPSWPPILSWTVRNTPPRGSHPLARRSAAEASATDRIGRRSNRESTFSPWSSWDSRRRDRR